MGNEKTAAPLPGAAVGFSWRCCDEQQAQQRDRSRRACLRSRAESDPDRNRVAEFARPISCGLPCARQRRNAPQRIACVKISLTWVLLSRHGLGQAYPRTKKSLIGNGREWSGMKS